MNIVGSVFGLDIVAGQSPPKFLEHPHVHFLNARSALLQCIISLKYPNVWLPSYGCSAVSDALRLFNIPISYYPIDHRLQISKSDWIGQIQKNDVVVLIDYFGFEKSVWSETIKRKGAIIIEDACQSLLSSHVGQFVDYVIYSPRKFVGVPDCGILSFPNGKMRSIEQKDIPFDWWMKSLSVCSNRQLFDDQLFKTNHWFQEYKDVENSMPIGNYKASEFSVSVLTSGTDWEFICRRRRENYLMLLEELEEVAIYKRLPYDVVPLGFPIIVEDRDRLQQAFFKEEIYPPIHWKINPELEKYNDSWYLSNHILTLICDQRYGKDEMKRIISVMKGFV
jgi:hypothetical protein